MATLKPIIVPAKILKGGKHKIRISVAHNAETRYIVTDIIIDSEKEFKNGQVVKRDDAAAKNTKIRKLMQDYQKAIDEINNIECLTCPELISFMFQADKRRSRTISSVFNEYIQYSNIKPGSKTFYQGCYRSLETFTGPTLLVEHINHRTVLGFDKWLREQKLSSHTIRSRMLVLLMIVKYSQRCLYAEYRVSPFTGYKMPDTVVRQSWLTTEQVKAIRDVQSTKKHIIKCRDLFMLSYYLGGINMCDLVKINFAECKGVIKYERTKTMGQAKINKFVEFRIPDEAKPIINRYIGKNGQLYLQKNQERWLMHTFFGTNLPKLAELAGIKKLYFYSARKSFSQHAFLLDVNTGVIDYILGHKIGNASSCLYSYIKVTPDMATKAVRKVLDNLK